MMIRNLLACGVMALCLMPGPVRAQHQEIAEQPAIWRGRKHPAADTASLLHAFKTGHFQGHVRYFFMATDNAGPLTDYAANAVGGGLRFETAPWRRFRLTVSGFFIFNVLSSDLTRRDSLTGQLNRYELGLFDIEDPGNRSDIDRLEELMLSYKTSKWELRLGRQLINTPFINLQDGRMRPTLAEGLWLKAAPARQISLEGGWISRISPRSTTRWYSMGGSLGVYPAGVQPDGSPAAYRGEIQSRGVALAGIKVRAPERLQVQLWDLWFEHVSNTLLLQADCSLQRNGKGWKAALQAIRQDALGNGGHPDPSLAYMQPGSSAMTWGARLGWGSARWETSLSYNRIGAQGRYLMPREWGRDPFFTFMPRERNEGLGDTHAVMMQAQHTWPGLPLKLSLASGYFQTPDVRQTALNKYGLPSYWQTNLDARYAFGGSLQGLELQLLAAGKLGLGETYGNYRYVFNKVDMMLYNVVLNYHF